MPLNVRPEVKGSEQLMFTLTVLAKNATRETRTFDLQRHWIWMSKQCVWLFVISVICTYIYTHITAHILYIWIYIIFVCLIMMIDLLFLLYPGLVPSSLRSLVYPVYLYIIYIPRPRIYPMRFARALVDLLEEMKRTAKGMPQLPDVVPAALECFNEWPSDEQIGSYPFARVSQVFNYLRGNRKLKIPAEWRGSIPCMFPEWATSWKGMIVGHQKWRIVILTTNRSDMVRSGICLILIYQSDFIYYYV